MNEELPGSGEDDVHPPARAARRAATDVKGPLAGQRPAVAAVAVGGMVGALARYGLSVAIPTPAGGFPTSTFLVNVIGCLLIGVLLVALTELTHAHPLLRPLLVTGVLGGFTTFSTYAVDSEHLLAGGHLGTALAYIGGTLVAALAAAGTGVALTRAAGRALGGPSRPGTTA